MAPKPLLRAGRLAPACWLAAPVVALAQASSPEPPKTVEAVTVTASSGLRTLIDRRSYDIAKDLQAATGSIADALRNVPSLSVDAQGALSLRGDLRVTILVDGKPSALFNGPGRAEALAGLQASQIERVEVMTNPSAAVDPEGSAGVINLVSKTARGAGRSGSAHVVAGGAAEGLAGATFGYNSKALTVTAEVSVGQRPVKFTRLDRRVMPGPADGQAADASQRAVSSGLQQSQSAGFSLGYAADAKIRFSADLRFDRSLTRSRLHETYETDTDGQSVQLLNRDGEARSPLRHLSLAAGWRRDLGGEDHQLAVDLTRDRTAIPTRRTADIAQSTPPVADVVEDVRYGFVQRRTELKVAYARPLPGAAKLKAGYELRQDHNIYDDKVFRGADLGDLTIDQSVSNRFVYTQTINSLYATYERPFGDLTAQAGIRLERVRLDLDQTLGGAIQRGDFGVYPSLHLTYRLDDQRQLTASYSRRVQRPPPFALIPYRIYFDPKDFQEGDPGLRPQLTDSFEVGYQMRRGRTNRLVTAYYRRNRREVTDLINDLGGGATLLTFGTLGRSRSAGLELVANGGLSRALTYQASANLSWAQIDAANLGFTDRRSTFSLAGHADINWQARPDDLVQLNASRTGRRLTPQGEIEPVWTVNLGWRHRFDPRISMVVTAKDLLASNGLQRTFRTPSQEERFRYRPLSRTLVVRLDYAFGGGKPHEAGFDYVAPGGSPSP